MGWRVTFTYSDQGDRLGGWSENYWNNLTSQSAVTTAAFALGSRLSYCKAAGVYWTQTRFSVPGSPRNSFTVSNNPAYTSGTPVLGGPNSPDYQGTKWLLKMQGPPPPAGVPGSGATKQWFGGVVDNSILSAYLQQSVVISSTFPSVVGLLTNAANGWSVNVLNPSFPPISIIAINSATGVVTCSGAYNFGAATVIRISRVRGLPYANGLWTWSPIGSSNFTFQLLNWLPQTAVMTTSPKANVRPQLYILNSILSCTALRSSNHRVGRPTGLFGGKRKRSTVH